MTQKPTDTYSNCAIVRCFVGFFSLSRLLHIVKLCVCIVKSSFDPFFPLYPSFTHKFIHFIIFFIYSIISFVFMCFFVLLFFAPDKTPRFIFMWLIILYVIQWFIYKLSLVHVAKTHAHTHSPRYTLSHTLQKMVRYALAPAPAPTLACMHFTYLPHLLFLFCFFVMV